MINVQPAAAEVPLPFQASASTSQPGFGPEGAVVADRFSADPGHAWKGDPRAAGWWWEARFPEPLPVGAILQVVGDDALQLRNAPQRYVWQGSPDGKHWHDLPGTTVERERRAFRLHRLPRPERLLAARLLISEAAGAFPALRAAEFYADPAAEIAFPDWAVVVSTTTRFEPVGHGSDFVPLARRCPGFEAMQAQVVWLGSFDEAFVSAEPRPLCAFLSGSFRDWCEVEREPWRGTEGVLKAGRLPMWASCGGAQGLAILSEAGVDREWDCPHCRDPRHPKLPIYTHVGHTTAVTPCGDYSACLAERGPFRVVQAIPDPAFAGLPHEFTVMESHCGQIEWVPKRWVLVAEGGPGALTKVQCLRVRDRPIYAVQFHIEMEGTPDVSQQIMANFLAEAKRWGGYRAEAEALELGTARIR